MTTSADPLSSDGFNELQRALLEEEIRIWPSRSWAPSAIGHPCDRHLVWRFNRHTEQSRYSYVLQSIFNYGTGREKIVRARMEALGYEWVEVDRPVQWVVGGGAIISGKLDGKIKGFRGTRISPMYVAEIKSLNGYTWDQLDTARDLKESRHHRIRGYYAQGQLYLVMENTPVGAFVLESKSTGLLKLIPFEIDYEYAEAIVKRIERMQPMMLQKADPPPIPYDPAVCDDCGFNRLCYPAKLAGQGTGMIEDPELLEMLETRGRLEEGHHEYDGLDKKAKARVKKLLAVGETAMCGPWTITIKEVAKGQTIIPQRVEQHVKFERVE